MLLFPAPSPLGEIYTWGKIAWGLVLDCPHLGVHGARGAGMQTPTWLLVMFFGAAILLAVVLVVYFI